MSPSVALDRQAAVKWKDGGRLERERVTPRMRDGTPIGLRSRVQKSREALEEMTTLFTNHVPLRSPNKSNLLKRV